MEGYSVGIVRRKEVRGQSITKSLGLLADQHARLQAKIETIPDLRSPKLLRDASSSHRSTLDDSADTASRSFIRGIVESALEQKSIGPGSTNPGPEKEHWDASTRVLDNQANHDGIIVPKAEVIVNCDQVPRLSLESTGSGDQIKDIPQNRRLVRELLGKSRPTALSFVSGDAKYGEKVASVKEGDESTWHSCNANLVLQAYGSSSAAKRMFVELRSIRLSKVPFISAVPLEDGLDKVLASIEGPPETPYDGGVFFITVKLSEHSQQAPLMRFQTKIYHPNISPQGHICADYVQRWNPKECAETSTEDTVDWWYHRKPGETVWSLGALLTALCGFLAAPEVDGLLVPEIAQKYVEDYCRSAKVYAQLYVLPRRPDNNDLVFLEDSEQVGGETA
ncbi:hypothetical protein ACEPPN_002197 [Leptodophora sp. 'Broadleaf-Isolate-01']